MILTEKKIVKIDRECKDNPVFIAWPNTLGGREHWLFHNFQTEGLNTASGGDFETFTEDIENSRGQIVDIQIFAQPQLICHAHVSNEDIQGLQTIFYGVDVEVLVNPLTWVAEGAKWQRYRPQEGSFKIINTDEVRSLIEVVFNKPYINTPKQ